MTTVLLGQSYYMRFDPKEWEGKRPYPPLGTLYAASYLRERGYDVRLFDSMLAESEDEWAAALDTHRPQFAVIYEDSFNYLSKMCLSRMREAAFTMIAAARSRGIPVLVSGSDATDHREKYFARGADGIIIGEGEITLAETLDALTGRSDTPPNVIPGLALPGHSEPAKRGFIKDLDALPFPAWDLVDIERYRSVWSSHHGFYSMNMVTTRGCPYHCNWCAKPVYGQRYNVRSPESVAAELRWLKENFAPDHIWFADDIFGLKPGWIERFASEVQRLDARLPFKCLLRVDLIKPGIPEALKRAGCEIVWVGAESGSQKILDAMDKGTKVEQIYAAARDLHAQGVKIAFFLQFGYPGEDRQDIEATLRMVRECRPDDIGMSVSYPLPGTKFYDNVRAQLGEKQNWLDSGDFEMMYTGPYSTAFYRKLHTVLHKEYRAGKTWRSLQSGDGPQSLGSRARATASMLYNLGTLPIERRKLDALARKSNPTPLSLPRILSPEAAATPSAQGE
ncbi:MAG: B12-binding domain-containing radical SAM protein [Chloroflexota bacterium]|nr:B12-binding domain-containing radical SAM protein [Chloroflexota bacterium]MDQ5865976.1 B12-binding domain-containing radical SAM protein [Chloroflexota bacterium]